MQKREIIETHQRIKEYIHNTPILTSSAINEIVGANIFFKCENFQKTGSFKIRGAFNALLQLKEKQRVENVVTNSSGNFGQALSYAASMLNINAYIVMPSTASQVKKDAVMGYGATIIESQPTLEAREATTRAIVENKSAIYIHPSNDYEVIMGQGTVSKELLETMPDLNCIVSPVGGGGLIAGNALATYYFGVNCHVIGAEPHEVDDAYRSLKSGKIEQNITTNTIADGLRTQLGHINFPIIQQHVERIIRVEEHEIVAAMRLIWERMKIIVEPSSAVALAAILKEKEAFENKKVGVILSGGNVDLKKLPF